MQIMIDHPPGQQLLHRLGPQDVPRRQRHARRGPHHHAERGARPGQVRLQRQDGDAHPERHDLQQVLRPREVLR